MILSRGGSILFKITENSEDWQPMELLKIGRVQFTDHDGQLQLLVMQWKGYDAHALVGLNMPERVSVCAKGLRFNACDSGLFLVVA